MNPKKIIIVGAGFAGVRAAVSLSSILSKEEITLINDTPYHVYHPDMYELITAPLKKETKLDFINLEGTTNIPLHKIFHGKNVEILVDQLIKIDPEKKTITTKKGQNLVFDYLVIGLGSSTNFFGTEGAENFSRQFKTTEDALNFRNDLEELQRQKDHANVLIVGGGLTGVELAGQLGFTKKFKVSVVEAAPNLITQTPVWAQAAAKKRLEDLGVRVYLNFKILKVDKSFVETQGQKIEYDYLVWTAGVKAQTCEQKLPMELNGKDQIKVTTKLNIETYPEIFVVGDIAECMDQKSGKPVPATAWAAIEQGSLVAQNIQNQIKNKEMEDYKMGSAAFVAPLGGRYALADLGWIKLSGFFGWGLKRLIALNYFISIMNFPNAFKYWWRGVEVNFE